MLEIFTSDCSDGSMKSPDGNWANILSVRTAFLQTHNIHTNDTTLVHLTYESDSYTRYTVADDALRGDGIVRVPSFIADGVVTNQKNLALFLPLADCVGAVLHDPIKNILMLSHLGRHNLEQHSGIKSVQYMTEQFDCDPENITAWLSPAAGQEKYPLFSFENRSMHDVATEQLCAAGVSLTNIAASPRDTTTGSRYFSHSEFLKGNQPTDGRFAIVCVMR